MKVREDRVKAAGEEGSGDRSTVKMTLSPLND